MDMTNYEQDFSKPELVPGDMIWQFGRATGVVNWSFVGVKDFGVSYYFVTGEEHPAIYDYLANIVS